MIQIKETKELRKRLFEELIALDNDICVNFDLFGRWIFSSDVMENHTDIGMIKVSKPLDYFRNEDLDYGASYNDFRIKSRIVSRLRWVTRELRQIEREVNECNL